MQSIHVVVAVIRDPEGRILVARRPHDKHQGGMLEFPGGKVEKGETVQNALRRELKEELDIDLRPQITEFSKCIQIQHDYADKSVLLDVWYVDRYLGKEKGAEGQPIYWLRPDELVESEFPAANRGIIRAVQLPREFAVSGDFNDEADLFSKSKSALVRGVRLFLWRAKALSDRDYIRLGRRMADLCGSYGAQLLVQGDADTVTQVGAQGLHLTSPSLARLSARPIDDLLLLGASCHSEDQLKQALLLKADYVFLSPVRDTQSHPDSLAIGWQKFSKWIRCSTMPVYALGGMSLSDKGKAIAEGGQGIAAISLYWS